MIFIVPYCINCCEKVDLLKKRTPELYQGVIAFTIAFVYLIFIAPFVSMFFNSIGMNILGVITTQMVIAGIALIFAIIIKVDFKETFPLRLPSIRDFFGAVFTYVGIYHITITASFIMMMLFPAMSDTIENLSTLTNIMPNPAIAVLVVAVMPAVCEELLMRGFILSSFSGQKSIVAIIIVGVMFGILHFDPFRFVPTAILGMASAYIVIKTKSIVLPMLYHLVNNIMSVIAMYQLGDTEVTEIFGMDYNKMYIALVFIYFAFALVWGYIGISLLNKKRENQKVTLIVVLISIALFVGGIIYMISNIDISQYYSQLNINI